MLKKKGLQCWDCNVVDEVLQEKIMVVLFFFSLTHVVSPLFLTVPSKPGQCQLYESMHIPNALQRSNAEDTAKSH